SRPIQPRRKSPSGPAVRESRKTETRKVLHPLSSDHRRLPVHVVTGPFSDGANTALRCIDAPQKLRHDRLLSRRARKIRGSSLDRVTRPLATFAIANGD